MFASRIQFFATWRIQFFRTFSNAICDKNNVQTFSNLFSQKTLRKLIYFQFCSQICSNKSKGFFFCFCSKRKNNDFVRNCCSMMCSQRHKQQIQTPFVTKKNGQTFPDQKLFIFKTRLFSRQVYLRLVFCSENPPTMFS